MHKKLCTAIFALLALPGPALAFPGQQYLGEVQAMPYDYCPDEWVRAEGQLMHIGNNTALFSLLGTRYGGDGRTTFALPDLRSAALISKRPADWHGDSRPVEPVQWCIAVKGMYPSRPH